MIRSYSESHNKSFLAGLSSRSEVSIIITLFAVFLLIGLIVVPRMYRVGMDEVVYTEPAVNLCNNGTFTSPTLRHQEDEEFFAGSTLLYPVLLSGWLHIFGFSILSVRMFNFVLTVLAVTMILISLKKTQLVQSGFLRIVVAILILLGDSLRYANGRYDILCFLLISSIFLVYSFSNKNKLYIPFIFLGALVPLAGLSLTVYMFILGFLVLIFQFRPFIKPWTFIVVGIFIGFIILFALFLYNNVLDDYLKYSLGHAKLLNRANIEPATLAANFLRKLTALIMPQTWQCAGFMNVKSILALFMVAIIVLMHGVVVKRKKAISIISFGLTASILIPAIMCMVGIYPVNYSWMAYVPLTICVCASINEVLASDKLKLRASLFFLLYLGIFFVACWHGLPKTIYRTSKEWDRRDYGVVREFVNNVVNPMDKGVYADYSAYYALKNKVPYILFPAHLKKVPDNEKGKVSVIIYDPYEAKKKKGIWDLEKIAQRLGGEWNDTGQTLGITGGYMPSSWYKLKVYRRNDKKIN